MAATTEQLDKLEAAINQGVLVVEYGDKKVTYRSLDEMKRIRRDMRIELGLEKNKCTRGTYTIKSGL